HGERGRGTGPAPAVDDLRVRALDRGLDRALGEHATKVRLVLLRALQVGLHVDTVGGLRGRGLDRGGVELLAGERRLHALCAYRRSCPCCARRDRRSSPPSRTRRGTST